MVTYHLTDLKAGTNVNSLGQKEGVQALKNVNIKRSKNDLTKLGYATAARDHRIALATLTKNDN
jgi:hypothetical protein